MHNGGLIRLEQIAIAATEAALGVKRGRARYNHDALVDLQQLTRGMSQDLCFAFPSVRPCVNPIRPWTCIQTARPRDHPSVRAPERPSVRQFLGVSCWAQFESFL